MKLFLGLLTLLASLPSQGYIKSKEVQMKIESYVLSHQLDSGLYFLNQNLDQMDDKSIQYKDALRQILTSPMEANYEQHLLFINAAFDRNSFDLISQYYDDYISLPTDREVFSSHFFTLYWNLLNNYRESGDLSKANELYEILSTYIGDRKGIISNEDYKRYNIKLYTHIAVLALIEKNVSKGLEICNRMRSDAEEIGDTNLIIASLYHKSDFLIATGSLKEYIADMELCEALMGKMTYESEYTPAVLGNLADAYIYAEIKQEKTLDIVERLESSPKTKKLAYKFYPKLLKYFKPGSIERKKLFAKFNASDGVSFCDSLWKHSETVLFKTERKNLVQYIISYLKGEGYYEDAMRYWSIEDKISSELYSEQLEASILDLNEKVAIKEREHTIRQLKEQKTRSYLIGALILSSILILVLILYVQLNKSKRRRIKSESSRNQLIELKEVKNRFFTNIAHELRTPLTLLIGPLENVINNESNLSKDTQSTLGLALKNAQRIKGKVSDIMELSRIEANETKVRSEEFKVKEYIDYLISLNQEAAVLEDLEIKVSHQNDNYVFSTDKTHLETIIQNLISNALKHSPKGGIIDVHTELINENLVVSVSDEGGAISPSHQAKIFELHYQTAEGREQGGFGIGLSLCKQLCDLLNGTIEVKVIQDQKTTFEVRLPLLRPALDALPSDSWSKNNNFLKTNFSSRPKLMLVDDSKEMLGYVDSVLSSSFKVYTANSVKDAFDLLQKQPVDLVVTDLKMPEEDGSVLIHQMNSDLKLKKIPVIVLSANDDAESKIRLLNLGIADFITKPFSSEELIARIFNVLQKKPIANKKVVKNNTQDANEIWLTELQDYLLINITDSNLTVADISEYMGVSERTLRRNLNDKFGVSPKAFLRKIRLEHAHTLLQNGSDTTVKELAKACGYKRADLFSKDYKNEYGKSPMEI